MAIENDAAFAPEKSERTAEMAARLAPVEEQQQQRRGSSFADGDASGFKVSRVFLDEADKTSRLLRPHPVILFILCIALVFIGFIAYLIAITPPPE